jgi:Tol biopolymer transport system component
MRHQAAFGAAPYWGDIGAAGIYLVSPLGGQERKLSDFPAGLQLSWSPDGRWLAAPKGRSGTEPPGGIYLIPAAGGEPRALTFPKAPAFDISPSFSPDGGALAYASCSGNEGAPVCDLYRLPLDSELRASGAAQPLTRQGSNNIGLAWTRDGRSILYSADFDLWRVRADGGAPPERVELAGAAFPSTASGRDRLAFVRPTGTGDIYRVQAGGPPTPVIASSFWDSFPQYAPDGRRFAFSSSRPNNEIWLADADGRNPTQFTHGPGHSQGTPGWSPDGRSIAFDSEAEDHNVDIWTLGVDGSGLRQITHDPANDIMPSWSRDGRFIYFASNRTGGFQIWRVPAGGGAEEQVTRGGGILAVESLDGKTLYYQRSMGTSPLLALPTAGGQERTTLPCVVTFGYAVGPKGIYHAACATSGAAGAPGGSLMYWDVAAGRDQPVPGLKPDRIDEGLSVSPDGRSIVYGRWQATSDLMMIENFR